MDQVILFLLGVIITKLDKLEAQMASAQGDINAADTYLQQLVTDLQNQSSALATITSGIAALQQQIAQGGTVSTADLDQLVSQTQAAQSGLDSAVQAAQAQLSSGSGGSSAAAPQQT